MASSFQVQRVIPAPPAEVFATITDIGALASWNPVITNVVDMPDVLEPDAEWVVELHALGNRWRSRSRVEEIDPETRTFRYRSATDDGNPSYALWTWTVESAPRGANVTVAVELHALTFWRKVLLAPIRGRQLHRRELPDSLERLTTVVPHTF